MKLLVSFVFVFSVLQFNSSLSWSNETLYKEVQWVQKKISSYKTIGQWVEKSSGKTKTKRRLLYGKLYDTKIPPMMAHKNQIFIFNKIGHLPDVLEVKLVKGQRQYYYNDQEISPQKNESEKQWFFRNYPHLKPRRYSQNNLWQGLLISKSWAIGLRRGIIPTVAIPVFSQFFNGVDYQTNPYLLALQYGADMKVEFLQIHYKLECVSSRQKKKSFEARYDLNGQVIPPPLGAVNEIQNKEKKNIAKLTTAFNKKCNDSKFRKQLKEVSGGSQKSNSKKTVN